MAKCEFCGRRELRYPGLPLPPPLQPSLEAQRKAREGDRQRHPEARLRVHPLPPFGQSYPRCVIENVRFLKSTG